MMTEKNMDDNDNNFINEINHNDKNHRIVLINNNDYIYLIISLVKDRKG